MKAIIIEDELPSATRLKKLVESHTQVMVLETFFSVKAARQWLKENETPDVLFLDIQLGDGTAFDILNNLSSFPKVIFTTAFDQYVMNAFRYNSVDYLLKPIKPEDLVAAIEKLKKIQQPTDIVPLLPTLQQQLLGDFKKKFLVKIGQKYRSVPIEQVAYFFSESSTTYLITREGDRLIVDHSLDELQKMLNPADFFRINRHMIITDSSIVTIDSFFNNRLLLTLNPTHDGQVIVSREKVRSFKEWLDR